MILSGGGRITTDAGKVGLYSTYFQGGFYVDTAVQGGYNAYDSNRDSLNGTAHGSPHGGDFNLLFAPGYNWNIGALAIGPTASFQYSYQGTNGFSEIGLGRSAVSEFPAHHFSDQHRGYQSILRLENREHRSFARSCASTGSMNTAT